MTDDQLLTEVQTTRDRILGLLTELSTEPPIDMAAVVIVLGGMIVAIAEAEEIPVGEVFATVCAQLREIVAKTALQYATPEDTA